MQTKRVICLFIVLLALTVGGSSCNFPGFVYNPNQPPAQSNMIPTDTPIPTPTALLERAPVQQFAPACKTFAVLDQNFSSTFITHDPTIKYLGQYCQNGLDYIQLAVPLDTQPPGGHLYATTWDGKNDPMFNNNPQFFSDDKDNALITSCQLSRPRGATNQELTCWGKPPYRLEVVAELQNSLQNSANPTCAYSGYTYDPNSKVCLFNGIANPNATKCADSNDTYDPVGHCCGENRVNYPPSCVIPETFVGQGYFHLISFANGASYCVSDDLLRVDSCIVLCGSKNIVCDESCSFGSSVDKKQYQFIDCNSGGGVQSCKKPSYCVPPSYQWDKNTCTCDYVPG